MSFDNDHYWQLAQNMYLHGKNSLQLSTNGDDDDSMHVEFRSLHSLARSDTRQGTMFFDSMLIYNNNDPYYADELIKDTFIGERYKDETRQVKASIIYHVILTQIIFATVLGEMQDAINHCHNISETKITNNPYRLNTISTFEWDQVAAYIIGSLEGSITGGSKDFNDGVFLWNLANRRGIEFGRDNDDGYAIVNSAVRNYLLSGKGQIQNMNCNHMQTTSKNIAYTLLIPMVQTIVKYAISNQFLSWSSDAVEIFEGEIYARFLIPIFREFSDESADAIQENMIRNVGSLVKDGPQAIADAYLPVAEKTGLMCEFVGKSFDVDACLNYKPTIIRVS